MTQAAISRLLNIMAQLRDPKTGCEWDTKQTWQSLTPHTLEETYEVIDAIAEGKPENVKKELGDLLYQIVFYAQIADEARHFNFEDICQAISDKLVSRHPHVFHDGTPLAKPNWELQKMTERNETDSTSILADIPNHLPALMKAQKIQKRCAAVGFDWGKWQPVLDKVYEEIDEVVHEVQQECVDRAKLEEELGDLLFATVNLTRHLGADAETILQRANQKFVRRFQQLENEVVNQQQQLTELPLEELEAAWQRVKEKEKTGL